MYVLFTIIEVSIVIEYWTAYAAARQNHRATKITLHLRAEDKKLERSNNYFQVIALMRIVFDFLTLTYDFHPVMGLNVCMNSMCWTMFAQ